MASKKVKLIQNAAMADKATHVLDLGEMDDLFAPAPVKKSKGPIKDFTSGFKSGLLGEDKGKSRLKSVVGAFARNMMPDSINRGIGTLEAGKTLFTDIVRGTERKYASDLNTIANEAQQLMPHLQGKVSDAMFGRLEGHLSNKVNQYKYDADSNANQSPLRRRMLEKRQQSAMDEESIKEATDHNSLLMQQTHISSEQNAERRFLTEQTERGIRDKISNRRYDYMSQALSITADAVTRTANYNEQIGYQVARRSLELQFRTAFGIRDLVKVSEAMLQMHEKGYTALVRNTGTPEHLKTSVKDLTKFELDSQVARASASIVRSTLQNFLGSYAEKTRDKVMAGLGNNIQKLSMFASTGSALPDDLWDKRYEYAGKFGASYAGNLAKNKIGARLGRMVQPHMDRAFDKFGGKQHKLAYLLDNAPGLAQEFMNDPSKSTGWRGWAQKGMNAVLPQFKLDSSTSASKYQTIEQGAQFNQMTQRVIVDAIPGLLSRILQETTNIRRGVSDVTDSAMIRYDITNGTFVEDAVAKRNLSRMVIGNNTNRNVNMSLDDSLSKIDPDGKLSPAARKALSARMLRDSAMGIPFNPERYMASSSFKDTDDIGVQSELSAHFKSKFTTDENGKVISNAENNKQLQKFSKAFLSIRDIVRDPYAEVTRLISSGHTEPLRMLGILITELGEDRINYERLWELMREDQSPDNPWGGSAALDIPESGASSTGLNREQLRKRFNQAKDKAKGLFDKVRGKAAGMPGTAEEWKVRAGEAYASAKGRIDTFDKDAFTKGADDLRNRASEALAPARDLIQAGTDRLLVRATDILNGDLMDINTGKIITDVKDITGEVINKAGDVIVSAVEAAVGLVDKNGIVVFKSNTELTGEFFANPSQALVGYAGKAQEQVGETIDAVFGIDWYVPGKEQPLLLGKDIRNGEYIDKTTQKVIQKAEDITGDIVDRSGEVVATVKDMAEGLYNPTRDKLVKLKGLAGALKDLFFGRGTLQSRVFGMAKHFGTKLAQGTWGAVKMISDRFIANQDAYIPDTDTPVVTGTGLRRGDYFDAKGKTITNFKDHNGPIFDAKGQVLVSDEQRKDLLNVDGTKHDLSKKRGLFARATRSMARGYAGLTRRYYSWLGKKVAGGIGGAISKGVNGLIDYGKLETPTDQLLGGILQTLQERLPSSKKEPRKGSWEEKLANAAKPDESEVDENGKPVGKGKGLFSKGMAGLAGLFGKGKKEKPEDKSKSDEEEDEGFGIGIDDLADAAVLKDAVTGGKVSRKAKKVGRLAKMGKALWTGTKALTTVAGLASAGSSIAGGAAAVGSGAMAVGGAVASGAAAILSGALAFISSPVVLGAAAVAALGYGAYKLHGWFTTRGEIRNLRLMQYGASSTSERKKAVELEAYVESKVSKGTDYAFKLSKDELMEMAKIMDIKVEDNIFGHLDKEAIMSFASWFDRRFKPVFVTAKKALDSINKSDVSLADIDSKVPDELKYSYLQAIQMPYEGNSPYSVTTNGFGSPSDPLTVTPDEIRAEFDDLLAKYKSKAGADPDKKPEGEMAKDSKTADIKDKLTEPSKLAAAGGAAVAVGSLPDEGVGTGTVSDSSFTSPVMDKVKRAGMLVSIGTVTAEPFAATKLTGLQSLRFRAYGLETADAANCSALLGLESFYYSNSKVGQDGQVDFTSEMGSVIQVGAKLFGFPNTEAERRNKFAAWFKDRFEPVFKAYLSSIKKLKGQIELTRVETVLSNTEKVQVGSNIIGAINDKGDIWKSESIFPIRGSLDGLQALATGELEYLKQQAAKDILETPTMTAGEQSSAQTQASGGVFSSFADSVKSAVKSVSNSVVNAVTGAAQTVGDTWSSTGATIASYIGGNSGTLEVRGKKFAGLEAASGGKWNEIPMPSQNKSKQAAQPMLEAISKMTGVPVELLNIFISLESGYDANAFAGKTNPKATATGLMQFINSTWDGMMKKYAKEYGLPDPSTDPQRAMRYDPRINALMGALYIRENYSILAKGLGREPSDVDMYMAHFLGPGTAIKFLKADPNIIGEKMFPEQARHNPGIFRQKSGQPRSLGEIYALMDKKIAPHRTGGGDVTLAKPGGDEVQTTSVEADVKADTKDVDAKSKDGSSTDQTPVNTMVPSTGPDNTGSTPKSEGDPASMTLGAGKAPPPPDFVSEDATTAPPQSNFPMQNNQSQKQAEAQERIRRQQLTASAEIDGKLIDINQKQLDTLLRIETILKGAGGINPMNPASNGNPGRSASTATPPIPFN